MAEAQIGVAVGASIAKSVLGFEAAQQENRALSEQELENRVAANDQTIQRQQALRKMLGAQIAQSAASGIAPSSASLQAIQIDSFNKAAEDQDLSNLQLDIENENVEQKKRNNREQAWIGAFDNVFGAAKFFAGLPDVGQQPTDFNVFGPSSSLTQTFREKSQSDLSRRFGISQENLFGGNI